MPSTDGLVDWATWAFSPSVSAIIVTLLISLLLPVFIHFYLYRKAASTVLPTFLLIGPSGGGKTTVWTLLSNDTLLPTQTSQEPQAARCQLPDATRTSVDKYRSINDTSARAQPSFLLIDTPGHGKLRHHANSSLTSASALRGLLFLVDSAALSSTSGLIEAAEYLYDVLMLLQKRHTLSKTSKAPRSIPVLVLANKQDVFTSLPPGLVQKKLEEEITKIRMTRSKGLLDSGIGMDDAESDEEQHWLGEYGSKHFNLAQMEEHGIEVSVTGGSAKGENGKSSSKVQKWWEWIGQSI